MDPITLHYQLNWGQIHDLFKGGGGGADTNQATKLYLNLF